MARTSSDKVLAILSLFTEDRLEWTPDEMTAALGYPRPTLYRYLRTLREAGLLSALPEAGFTLGPRVVELDFLMRRSDPLLREGAETLRALAARQPCTALLVRWYGNRLLCVASEVSAPDPLSSYARGRPMPLTRGAISRAILAFLPRREQAAMVAARLDEFAGAGLGDSVAAVLERLRAVRRTGFAVAHGEVTPGVVGIAAPVFDSARSPIAALCVTLEASTIAPDTIEPTGAAIAAAAEALSGRLGTRRDCARAAE